MDMGEHYDALVTHLGDVQDIATAASLLNWDRDTQMPPGGAEARARQLSTLTRIYHEMFTSEKTLQLLEAADAEIGGADYDSDEASMIRVIRLDYDDETRLPADFVAKQAEVGSLAHGAWQQARQENDFSLFQDTFKRVVEMTLQEAQYLGYDAHPYDAMLNKYDRGVRTADVEAIFDAHRPRLAELISKVAEARQIDNSFLRQPFDIGKQKQFVLDVVTAFGFDFERGVQATASHPFCTRFSKHDVRMAIRFNPDLLNTALFTLMHESGHGMYNQGIDDTLEGTLLAFPASFAVDESQARLWENIIGRSKEFWIWALPRLQKVFPQLNDISLERFYKGINQVQRSFIRTEADEATYNLHIILRFELEKDILAGSLKVEDLPDAWNSKFTELFGMTPPDAAQGVLQDIHWSMGLMGYFPTYALGNLLSVQYYNKAISENPRIPGEIAIGNFEPLLSWLNQNIHRHGRKFTAAELTHRVTGQAIQSDDYVTYLEAKYGEIYEL